MNKLLALLVLVFFVFIPKSALAATYTANPTVDTFISQNNPNSSYDNSQLLLLQHIPNQNLDSKILVKFDISQIPKCSTINFAKIELWENGGMGTAIPAMLDGARITSNWDGAVTWNTKPTVDGPSTGIQDMHAIGYKQWQVTDHVQKWLDGKYPNYGFQIYYGGAQNLSVVRSYDSNSNANQHKPILTVTYTPPGVGVFCPQAINLKITPIVPKISIAAQESLSISDVSVSADKNSAVVNWKTNKNSTSRVWYGIVNQGVDDTSIYYGQDESVTAHQVKLTDLKSDTKYSFKVYSKDSNGNEKYSSVNYFTTSKPDSSDQSTFTYTAPESEQSTASDLTPTPASSSSSASSDKNSLFLPANFVNKYGFSLGLVFLAVGTAFAVGSVFLFLELKKVHNNKENKKHKEEGNEETK